MACGEDPLTARRGDRRYCRAGPRRRQL